MSRKKWLVLTACLVGVLLLGAAGVGLVRRCERLAPRIVVVNNAGRPLADVRLATFDARRQKHVRRAARLAPGERVAVSVSTSDLFVEGLSFRCDGREVKYDEGGIATPGEVFVLSVEPSLAVRTGYEGY